MKTNKTYDLIVIGGGPSGMMVAGRAAELGADVILFEKNEGLGKKLSISGGGRCNITNAEFDVKKFLANFPKSQKFLYSPFSKFSSKDTFTFFEKKGLELVVEDRNRAFPKSQKATDVMDVMNKYVTSRKVTVKLNAEIESLEKDGEHFSVRNKDGEIYKADNVAIATGGLAAPGTGSTGDGFKFLEKLGHTITEPNPNVVPLTVKEEWVHSLSGLSLPLMKISFIQNNKVILKKLGEVLFTHFGLSGPLILNSSQEVQELLKNGKLMASIDLFPEINEGELNHNLWKLFEYNKNKILKNVLSGFIPAKLSGVILDFFETHLADTPVHSISKEIRSELTKTMKNLSFEITGTLGFDKAVISNGGVILEEVNFKNMTSKIHPNLYLLGDVLNINRPSGGFSLQLCWTTGWVAGSDIGENLKKSHL